jgi:PDZ domain-containing secreted protein
VQLDGVRLSSAGAWDDVLGKHKPGDRVPLRFVRRSGETVEATLTLEEDPGVEIVPVEKTGGTLSDEQRRFRESWLGSLQKR